MAMGSANEQNLDNQMGCMAGFLQLLDRHHFLTGKRLYSTKRLPPSRVVHTSSDLAPSMQPSSMKSNVIYLKDGSTSSWKFDRDSPRLSLDSRATMDVNGGLHPKKIRTSAANLSTAYRFDAVSDGGVQQRSPSVIARLMGLEEPPPGQKPELRRSASESRASRDLFHSRFAAEGRFMSNSPITEDGVKGNAEYKEPIRDHSWTQQADKAARCKGSNRIGSGSPQPPWKASLHRKWLFDSGDIFPEPKQATSIHGEIGKRLKTRGVHEGSNDLETLKQILETLQLKGLLHSSCPNQARRRVFVYDDSPLLLIRSLRMSDSTLSKTNPRYAGEHWLERGGNRARGIRWHRSFAGEDSPSENPRLERYVSSPMSRHERNASTRGRKSPVNPKPTSAGTQKRLSEPMENRRVAANQSPIRKPRRSGPDHPAHSGSFRSKKTADKTRHRGKTSTAIVVDDESSSISVSSSITTSSDTERSKTAGYKQRKNLLENDAQPSPVSVLEASFKDETLTPSPVKSKRNLDFKDECVDLVDEIWGPVVSPSRMKCEETADDSAFFYISDILRASSCCLSEESDVFMLLEKQQFLKGKDTSKVSRLQRRLIFDTTTEILDRNKEFPPWKTASWDDHNANNTLLNRVWCEFQKIREPTTAQDLFGVICSVLMKDLSAGDSTTGWVDWPVEESGVVLDMERMIFRDLIGETIQDLAALTCRSSSMSCQKPRKKSVF